MFYTCNYNIRVTQEMVLLSIFYTNQIHGGIISRLFFIHFVAPCACSSSSGVKLLKSFCMKILSTLAYIHLSVVFPSRMPAGPHFVTQPILLSENILIFDINHQQNTRRSDQIETIKTIMQTTPSYHMEGFTNGSGCHF